MKKYKPHFFLFLTIIFWGSSFPILDNLLAVFSPAELALTRFIFPACLSLSFIMIFKKFIDKEDFFIFFLSGFLGIFCFSLFINLGLQTMSVGAGSFIVNCNPLFASLIGVYIFKQNLKPRFLWGIIFCILGVFVISMERNQNFNLDIGAAYLILAAISISFYFHLVKRLVNKYGSLTTFCYTIVLGTIPMIFWFHSSFNIFLHENLEIKLNVIWLSLVSTLIPYYTWNYSVLYFGANKASFFLFLIPIVAILIDFIFFNKIPTFYTLLGGFFIITTMTRIMFLDYKDK